MKKNIKYIAVIILSVILIVGLLLSQALIKKEKLDPKTGCKDYIENKSVFLIDHSEDVSSQTKEEITNRIKKIINSEVKVGELVSVYFVTELSKKNLLPAFSYCKPKPPADSNAMIENEKIISKNYNEKFYTPLIDKINTTIPGAKESPIAQAIVDLSLLSQLKDAQSGKLYIFSDLIEHKDNKFSMYKQCDDASSAISIYKNSVGTAKYRPSFNNLKVELHMIPRASISSSIIKCRDKFWVWFFGDINGEALVNKFDLPG